MTRCRIQVPYDAQGCRFVVVLLEDCDLVIIGVAAAKIAEHLQLAPNSLGLAIGAGQVGLLIGPAALDIQADQFARKRMSGHLRCCAACSLLQHHWPVSRNNWRRTLPLRDR